MGPPGTDAEKSGDNDQTPVIRDMAPETGPTRKRGTRVRKPTIWDSALRDSFAKRPNGWKSTAVEDREWRTTRDKIIAAGRSMGLKVNTESQKVDKDDEDYKPGVPQRRVFFNAKELGPTAGGIPGEVAWEWYKE